MTIIGMKELRTNTAEITRRVQAGESFRVVSRSKPMFDITPLANEPEVDTTETEAWTRQYVQDHRKLFESLSEK
jgi:prevent-host-death family protein